MNFTTNLNRLGIQTLNEMQLQSLDAHHTNNNVLLLSATGSGKTLAFLLPLYQYFNDENRQGTLAIIVAPTRELALQLTDVFKKMVTGVSVTCCYGGHKREIEENNLLNHPTLIIGTPGRLCDHIRRGNIQTAHISCLVLDEFDKSLELGFREEIYFIRQALPAVQKYTLVSATFSEEIETFFENVAYTKVDFSGQSRKDENQFTLQFLNVSEDNKLSDLFRLLCFHGDKNTVIFCNFRDTVEQCSSQLKNMGIHNVFYHGSMEQRDRELALSKFMNGSSQFLVTTDLAARGLDFDHVRFVIHYQLPLDEKSFIHRNGRTARMDKSGTAILLLSPGEYLPKYIDRKEIEEIQLPEQQLAIPGRPQWTTLYVSAGKKNKVNKIDIVGFLAKTGNLKMEDIGKINVWDFHALVAIRRSKATHTLHLIQGQKLKGKKVKIEIAK